MARIIAIDYGSKRTGLAVTDPLQMIATALDTVPTHQVLEYLKKYIAREPVELFVVGEAKPINQLTHQPINQLTEAFIKILKKNFQGIKIEKEDERFTSKMAFQTMLESGISKSKRRDKGLVDKISAVLILQSYLERKSNDNLSGSRT